MEASCLQSLVLVQDCCGAVYQAGVFTEFMEQRSPGRTVLDDNLYRKGLVGLLRDIDSALEPLDLDADALARQEELRAMAICARAVIGLAGRYAAEARARAAREPAAARRGNSCSVTLREFSACT